MPDLNMIYLDYAASTPIDPEIWEEFSRLSLEFWANPSSIHSLGNQAHNQLQLARQEIADLWGIKPKQIVFTSGVSEANNLAVFGILNQNPGLNHCLISNIEHPSLFELSQYSPDIQTFPVNKHGLAEVDTILNHIQNQTRIISLMLVNNEIGTIQPILELAQALVELNQQRQEQGLEPILLHTDATQAPLYLDIKPFIQVVDLLTLGSQKLYAPRGAGLVYIKPGLNLIPQILGGGQEHGLRSGTPNVAAIGSLAMALVRAERLRQTETSRLRNLRDQLIQNILNAVPGSQINGFWQPNLPLNQDLRIANNAHLSFTAINQEALLTWLDLHELCASAGSGCHSGAGKPSQVAAAIGLNANLAHLRLSLGIFTTSLEVEQTTGLLQQAVKHLSV